MKAKEAEMLKCRIKCIVDMMVRQGPGHDIHMIDNLRHTAAMLISAIDHNAIEFDRALEMVKRIEDQTIILFKRRFIKS